MNLLEMEKREAIKALLDDIVALCNTSVSLLYTVKAVSGDELLKMAPDVNKVLHARESALALLEELKKDAHNS